MMDAAYRYGRFHRELLVHDMAFEGGPSPGADFPDFDLPTVDDGNVTKADLVACQPMLMVFASFT